MTSTQSPATPGTLPAAYEVKNYLAETLQRVETAAERLCTHAQAYAAMLQANGGAVPTWATHQTEVQQLVEQMREDYRAIDSFGYEFVEGIVAGVPRFASYDLYLDGGLPQGAADATEIAPVSIRLADGELVDRQGSNFTYLLEPALWGGDSRWCVPVDLNGDGQISARESLPRPEFITAVANDARQKLAELSAAVTAWRPTAEECYQALVAMAPTLSDCLEDWKEARYADQQSGRFSAVSRLSDLRGILGSCSVMFQAIQPEVKHLDRPLARIIEAGLQDVTISMQSLEAREQAAQAKFNPAVVDEIIYQAKTKSDRLVPQLKAAAALAGVTTQL